MVAYLLKAYYQKQTPFGERAAPRAERFEPAQASPEIEERGYGRRNRRGGRRERGRRDNHYGPPGESQAPTLEQPALKDLPTAPRAEAAVVESEMQVASTTVPTGFRLLKVNIGFDDGFKGRGSVAKKISSLAGLNDGIVTEVEARRTHSLLQVTADIADLVMDRVDGAQIGRKILTIAMEP